MRVFELLGGVAIIPENPRAIADPLPITLHILSSFFFCIIGGLQFLPSLRRHHPTTHRTIGRAVAFAGGLSALTGLWMTHFFSFPKALQGDVLYWARIGLSLLMLGLIMRAVIAIRSRNVVAHRNAMLRAYAIGQGASTQAVLGIAWILLIGAEPIGQLRDGMMIFAWCLNLFITEVIISRLYRPQTLPV